MTNIISKTFGLFASKEFTPTIQSFINNSYVKLLGLDMSEFDKPSSYKSLNALFTREIKSFRDFEQDSDTFISPVDSYITDMGECDMNVARQIKGMRYFIDDLLTSQASYVDKVSDGDFVNFYLSPKDYHRYHSPYDLKVKKLIHVGGKLYPVNIPYLQKKLNLFVENERVILECFDSDDNVVYLVFVGALNVGKMVFDFEPKVQTNISPDIINSYEYNDLELKKAQEIGYFKMGSTVVMITQKDYLDFSIKTDIKLKFGDTIAKIKNKKG